MTLPKLPVVGHVQWQTLFANERGVFDRDKIKSMTAVFLALVGGLALVGVSVYEALSHNDVNTGSLALMAGICVAPLTGGTVASAFAGRKEMKETEAVIEGRAPGRRASDPDVPQ